MAVTSASPRAAAASKTAAHHAAWPASWDAKAGMRGSGTCEGRRGGGGCRAAWRNRPRPRLPAHLRPLGKAHAQVDVAHVREDARDGRLERRVAAGRLAHGAVVREVPEEAQPRVACDGVGGVPGVEEEAAAVRLVVHGDAQLRLERQGAREEGVRIRAAARVEGVVAALRE